MTAGIPFQPALRPLRRLALAAALLLPIGSGGPALAEDVLADDIPALAIAEAAVPPAPVELSPVALDVAAPEAQGEAAGTRLGSGTASYYGRAFHGRRTASGERFDMNAMTAAHRTLPFGSKVRVTNVDTGASVIVTINDRGPFTHGRLIDVSHAAAAELGLIARGRGQVELELLEG